MISNELTLFDLVDGFWNKPVVIELIDETAIEGHLIPSDKKSVVLVKDAVVYSRRIRGAIPVQIKECYIKRTRIRFIHFTRFGEIFHHLRTSMKAIGNLMKDYFVQTVHSSINQHINFTANL